MSSYFRTRQELPIYLVLRDQEGSGKKRGAGVGKGVAAQSEGKACAVGLCAVRLFCALERSFCGEAEAVLCAGIAS
jgi:hypothetical protein